MTKRRFLTTAEEVVDTIESGQAKIDMKKAGIIDALDVMQSIPECNSSDVQALAFVKQVIYAMEFKKRQAWPNKELRSIVNKLDKYQKKLFFEVLIDIRDGLLEAGYETENE